MTKKPKKSPAELSILRKEVGRRGGLATLKKHGNDHFNQISPLGTKKRWPAQAESEAATPEPAAQAEAEADSTEAQEGAGVDDQAEQRPH